MNILVSSNCQTEGIAEALKVMLPNHVVSQMQILPEYKDWSYLKEPLNEGINILVTSNDHCCSADFTNSFPDLQVIHIPKIVFSAFHPDLVYATDKDGNFVQCLSSNYHSAICLWGWKNKVPPDKTISLFNKTTFSNLGYFNSWNQSFDELKNRFKNKKLDFTSFWQAIKNTGLFMHSIDHPNIYVLSELAKLVAIRLGSDQSLINEPTQRVLSDTLTAIRWPIYPEIGELYGIVGMYKWKIRKDIYVTLDDYIHKSYSYYDSLKIDHQDINFYSSGYAEFNSIISDLII